MDLDFDPVRGRKPAETDEAEIARAAVWARSVVDAVAREWAASANTTGTVSNARAYVDPPAGIDRGAAQAALAADMGLRMAGLMQRKNLANTWDVSVPRGSSRFEIRKA